MTETTIDFDRYDRIRPIRWTGEALELLDQRKLVVPALGDFGLFQLASTAPSGAAAVRPLALRRGAGAR